MHITITPRATAAALFITWATLTGTASAANLHGGTASPPRLSPGWRVLVGPGRVPRLSQPEGLAIDQRGTSAYKWMYVADTANSRIVKFGTGGHFLGVRGHFGTGPGQFDHPQGVAVDKKGDVYVADTGNNRIEAFGPGGAFLSQWGTRGSGRDQFASPTGIAVGGSGNIFVADRGNGRIEKFSSTGRLLAVWPVFVPGQNCQGTDCLPNGLESPGPYALTVAPNGNVTTAVDTGKCSGGHCVMDYIALETLSPAGTILRTVVGGNPYGPFSNTPVTGVTSVQGPWWQIGAVTADSSGHILLLAWYPEEGAAVIQLTPAAQPLNRWALPAPNTGWPGQGIALDPHGNAYVSDTPNKRLLALTQKP